jgi:site-specific recombinase XerC
VPSLLIGFLMNFIIDAAIISCMVAGGGMRRSEVVILDLSDYDSLSGQIRIVGKGEGVGKIV